MDERGGIERGEEKCPGDRETHSNTKRRIDATRRENGAQMGQKVRDVVFVSVSEERVTQQRHSTG